MRAPRLGPGLRGAPRPPLRLPGQTARVPAATGGLRVATWNIHRAVGRDGHRDPDRVLATAAEHLRADILVLTEADEEPAPHAGILNLEALCRRTGLAHAQADPALRWGAESHGFLGVVVLAAPQLQIDGGAVLDLPGVCPRGAVVLEARHRDRPFRLIATHLALFQPLRAMQMRTIGQYLRRCAPVPTVLVGDLNEWRPWRGLAFHPRLAAGLAFRGPARPTFPAARPVLPLDRVLTAGGARVLQAEATGHPAFALASDHRPLTARITLE